MRIQPIAAACLLLAPSVASAPLDDPLAIDVSQEVYDVSDPVLIQLSGGPAAGLVFLLLDLDPGPVVDPFFGMLDVGLSPAFTYVSIPPVADGSTLDCGPPGCDSPLVGIKVYLQLVAIDTLGTPSVSNGACLSVEDLFGACAATGCTPGYWMTHLATWGPTGYSPGDDFDATFGVDVFEPDVTLLEALQPPAIVAPLEFHAVAALLNASHPDQNYAYSAQEVIDLTAAAFAAGGQAVEDQKDDFDVANNAGCPF